jgi:hypothetical protein
MLVMQYPAVDPIPIPAPVWLMKLLSHVTLALHFSAVMILVGTLLLVVTHNLRGRSSGNADAQNASYVLARRLPVLMTWVINLGVPPLLFAQVLYGRAIYSSSVLIAVSWISVIFLVMFDYWLLYRIVNAMERGKAAWPIALISLLVTMGIGQIYSMNMTLMLRPEVWQEMYAKTATGLQGVSGDPTMTPRWLFVMCGGLVFGGVWTVLLSNMKHIAEGTKAVLRKSGGLMAAIGAALQVALAIMVVSKQPDAVKQSLSTNGLASVSSLIFLATIALTLLLAAFQGTRKESKLVLSIANVLTAFLANAGAVLYRDAIRDATLMSKGFDVWKRTEVSNWSVIGLFLLLFVIMLVVLVWILNVMRLAKAPSEQVIQ